MLSPTIISRLKAIGFSLVGGKTFRLADPKSEIEKILIIEKTEKFKLFQAYFGGRKSFVERFSWECLTTFSPASPKIPYQGDESLLVRFPVGRNTVGGWKLEVVSTTSRVMSEAEAEMIELVNNSVSHLISAQTLLQFRDILLSDSGPFGWDKTNPVSRSAQIFALSRQLGSDTLDIYAELKPFVPQIERQLRGGAFNKFFDFLDQKWSQGPDHTAK